MVFLVRASFLPRKSGAFNYDMEEIRQEDDQRRRFQERFDLRYVLKDGEYSIIRLLVFGFCGLILVGVITAVIALVIK